MDQQKEFPEKNRVLVSGIRDEDKCNSGVLRLHVRQAPWPGVPGAKYLGTWGFM